MRCPIPKFLRHRFVGECKPMQVGVNDETLKHAAFAFIDRHFKFCAPYEVFSINFPDVERAGEKIGSYVITVSRSDVPFAEAKEKKINENEKTEE